MKTCKDCHNEKEQIEFYGLQGECKDCTRLRVARRRLQNPKKIKAYEIRRIREPDLIFLNRYNGMKARTKGTTNRKLHYTALGKEILSKEAFIDWCYLPTVNKQFNKLYLEWSNAGFIRKLTPSIDRINPAEGYVINNLQWITQSENARKGILQRHTF